MIGKKFARRSQSVVNFFPTGNSGTDNNKMDDFTKCEAYKYCGKDIDWDEDGTTTTRPTTVTGQSTTSRPTTITQSTTSRPTTVTQSTTRPTGSTTKPDIGDSTFACS